MSKYSEKDDQLVAIAKTQEQAASTQRNIDAFIRQHQVEGLLDCQANKSLIYDYFHGDLEDITEAALEDCWAHHSGFRKSLAQHETETDVRVALSREIYSLLAGSPEAKKHVIDQLKYKELDAVLAQRDELKRRVAIRELPTETIRELAKGTPTPQWKPIPPLYRSRAMILSSSPEQIRSLVKHCGLVAVNEILSKRKD